MSGDPKAGQQSGPVSEEPARDSRPERLRAALLANASHELRTLLNGVLGMLGLTLDTQLTHEQREYLQTAQSSSESLLTLLDDLLDAAKMDAGRLELERLPFSPREVLEQSLRSLAPKGYAKGLELVLDAEPSADPTALGDPSRLRQIAANLVSNAIKFTARGEVVLRCWRQPADSSRLRVSVKDTGRGIPQERLAAVFEPFSQADESISREYGGTGLGLTVCRQLVTLMGGTLSVQSAVGVGSTFSFDVELPLAPDKDSSVTGTLTGTLGRNVLLVEDHAPTRAVLRRRLEGWGIQVFEAASPQEALGAYHRATAGGAALLLALVDHTLPQGGALALVEALQTLQPRGRSLSVAVMTAGKAIPAEQLRRARVLRALAKPLSMRELASFLGALVTQSLPRVPAQRPSQPSLRPLRVLLAEDNAVNARVATRLLERDGHAVTLASDGRAALEALAKLPFDVVLLDVQMPLLDGLEVARLHRAREARERLSRVPLVLLTANAMQPEDPTLAPLELFSVLLKPLDPQRLRAVLAAVPVAAT